MPAASTNPGPTSRFITSYLTKVHDALAGSRFRNPKERNGVLDAWRVPRAPGLQSKIRNAAANGVAEMLFLRHKNARGGGAIAETKAN
jgi:hypothetical protein